MEKLNALVRKMDAVDVGLVKFTLLFVGILMVKIFPQLIEMFSYPVLLVIIVGLAGRPVFRVFVKKN